MDSYIVDTSVLIKRFVLENDTNHAITLFHLIRDKRVQVIVPEFCLLECVNVLWRHVRVNNMSASYAQLATDILVGFPITLVSGKAVYGRALQIGLKHQLPIYDSIYIALSERLSFPLVTADAKQAAVAHAESVMLRNLTQVVP